MRRAATTTERRGKDEAQRRKLIECPLHGKSAETQGVGARHISPLSFRGRSPRWRPDPKHRVAQQPRRQHDGAMIAMFRCRFSGLGPNADVWRSRADCVKEHPGNAETLLARFRDTCVAVP